MRDRFHAFTVDEYQDVNPLQAALLDAWLGDRDELCVVGDDYQTIYSFTGASPEHLLTFPTRYPDATVVRLQDNFRSSPQVLAVANALVPTLGGFEKLLRATRPDGPNPTARALPDAEAEVAFVVGEVRRLHETGVAHEEMAVLYRINARSEPFEEAFAAASIPYQVRDGSFLRRPGPRSVLAKLRNASSQDAVAAVEAATDAVGFDANAQPDDTEEVTRQADLARLRALAAEYRDATGGGDVAGYVAELDRAVLHPAERARREPADVPSLQGVGMGRGVPAPAARQGTAVPDAALERRSRRGTPAVLRRHHPGAPAPLPVLAAGGSNGPEPVPGGDRGRQAGTSPPRNGPHVPRYR